MFSHNQLNSNSDDKKLYITSAILILFISSCYKDTSTINNEASFPPDFNFLNLKLKVITSIINTNKNTTSVLYGNDLAFKKSIARDSVLVAREQYVLVTWSQRLIRIGLALKYLTIFYPLMLLKYLQRKMERQQQTTSVI